MGMYDEVQFEAERPELEGCRDFQTKSLDRILDRYVVTKAGRLCRVGNVIADETPDAKRQDEPFDIECHGDIRLVTTESGEFKEFVARFTHGTLESIRLVDLSLGTLPELMNVQRREE